MTFATIDRLFVLATEGGIPASSPWAKVAVPLGIFVFIGATYLLVRANLGTRRGYLVTATSWFGFLVIYALFWAFGAPGTPANTGPQNLPGQELDAYQKVWRPFAGDSLIAEDPTYAVVQNYPDGFTADPPSQVPETELDVAAEEIHVFFSTQSEALPRPPLHSFSVALEDQTLYAVAENGRVIAAAAFVPSWQVATGADVAEGEEPPLTPNGEAAADDGSNVAPPGTQVGDPVQGVEPQVFFAYFDPGGEYFPSLLMLGLVTVLFLLHAALLWRDETRERREQEAAREAVTEEQVRVEA